MAVCDYMSPKWVKDVMWCTDWPAGGHWGVDMALTSQVEFYICFSGLFINKHFLPRERYKSSQWGLHTHKHIHKIYYKSAACQDLKTLIRWKESQTIRASNASLQLWCVASKAQKHQQLLSKASIRKGPQFDPHTIWRQIDLNWLIWINLNIDLMYKKEQLGCHSQLDIMRTWQWGTALLKCHMCFNSSLCFCSALQVCFDTPCWWYIVITSIKWLWMTAGFPTMVYMEPSWSNIFLITLNKSKCLDGNTDKHHSKKVFKKVKSFLSS